MANTHVELDKSRRPLASGARRVRDIDPHAHVEVTIALKAPPLPSAEQMPGKAIKPEEFARRYGAAPETIRKVEDALRSYGLHVEGISPTRRSLRVSGTAAAMEAAFKAGLGIYRSAAQGEFRGREGTLQVPAEIADLVTAVLGLDQRRVARRKAAGAARIAVSTPLTPANLEAHYNFPPGDAQNQSIAIAEFGAPLQSGDQLPPTYFPTDVSQFCEEQGRAIPNIQTVPVNLAPLSPAQYQSLPPNVRKAVLELTTEVMMDVEIVAALCSAAKISVYYASFDQKGWVDLLERVTGDQPVALSISYGLAEDSPDWEAAALQAINDALQAASMVGITVCVSSGDDGSGCDMNDSRAHVEFPGSSPFVLSVGGTMLRPSDQAEVVWWQSPGWRTGNGNSGATGGGISTLFERPAWQKNVNIKSLNEGSIDGRVMPDVAALAGPPFYELVLQGRSAPNGGTSASAPMWAALIARIDAQLLPGKKQQFFAPLLYQALPTGGALGAAGCTDITVGNNASDPYPGEGYAAQKSYDAVSGWGVPNGAALLKLL